MTYDLTVWPVGRALTYAEAVAELDALRASSPFRLHLGHDERLDPFIAALGARHGDLRGRGPLTPPFEFDVHRGHIFIGIGWSQVETVVADVSALAWETGLAVFDPQREAVGLPAPFADAPMTTDGLRRHIQAAEDAFAAIGLGVRLASGEDEASVQRHVSEQLTAAGFRQASPLGIEITPDVEAEVQADPTRMPSRLQTPERKAKQIAGLAASVVGARHLALVQLAGWDPDPEVAAALRPVLASEDVFEASQAAAGLARQGDITDLPAVLDLVRRMSPADGGTVEAMLLPLRAAFGLASLAGPMAVEGVRARARTWRGEPRVRRQSWEQELDRELEELLGDG